MGRPTRAELLERITYNPDILDSRILVTLDKDFGDSSCATDIHMLGFGASSRIRSDYRHQWLSTLSNSLVTRSWPAPS